MPSDALREEFEKWVLENTAHNDRSDYLARGFLEGKYVDRVVHFGWRTFQRAHALGRRAGLEEAAMECESYVPVARQPAEWCAKEIRALKDADTHT